MGWFKKGKKTIAALGLIGAASLVPFIKEQPVKKVPVIETIIEQEIPNYSAYFSAVTNLESNKLELNQRHISIPKDRSLTPYKFSAYSDLGPQESIPFIIEYLQNTENAKVWAPSAETIYYGAKFYDIHWLVLLSLAGKSSFKDEVSPTKNPLFSGLPTFNLTQLKKYENAVDLKSLGHSVFISYGENNLQRYADTNTAVLDLLRYFSDSVDTFPKNEEKFSRSAEFLDQKTGAPISALIRLFHLDSFDENDSYIPIKDLKINEKPIKIPKSNDLEFLINSSSRDLKNGKSIIVLPEESKMYLLEDGKIIREYVCATGKNHGGKVRQGDKKTPRGLYLIIIDNPHSRFHYYLGIDYPNPFDLSQGRTGGTIGIHGNTTRTGTILITKGFASDGCIRILNSQVDEMLKLGYNIGTKVLIADDLEDAKNWLNGENVAHNRLPDDSIYKVIVPAMKKITDRYGKVRKSSVHKGIDISAPHGSPVRAFVEGVATSDYNSGLGKFIKIEAENGYTFFYGHLSKVTSTGLVKAGEKIGEVGNTGNSFGSHLHLAIKKNGITKNPDKILYALK